MHLREKQKVKRYYGVLERQFRKYFQQAERDQGQHRRGPDEPAWNAAWTTSSTAWASASRGPRPGMMITHGHITVNGRLVNIPSYLVRARRRDPREEPSQEPAVGPGQPGREQAARCPTSSAWSKGRSRKATCSACPEAADVSIPVQTQLIVELCSK